MPDTEDIAKAEKWFSVEWWFDVFADKLEGNPKAAAKLMALMGSLREMIESGKAGRRAESQAVQNAMQACGRYTKAQLLAEAAERQWQCEMQAGPPNE